MRNVGYCLRRVPLCTYVVYIQCTSKESVILRSELQTFMLRYWAPWITSEEICTFYCYKPTNDLNVAYCNTQKRFKKLRKIYVVTKSCILRITYAWHEKAYRVIILTCKGIIWFATIKTFTYQFYKICSMIWKKNWETVILKLIWFIAY